MDGGLLMTLLLLSFQWLSNLSTTLPYLKAVISYYGTIYV